MIENDRRAHQERHKEIAQGHPEGITQPRTIREMNTTALAQIDAAASVAHDFIYSRNGVTQEQASRAIWLIHDTVNSFADAEDDEPPALRMPGERYEDYLERSREDG